jgi:hypothetical protein
MIQKESLKFQGGNAKILRLVILAAILKQDKVKGKNHNSANHLLQYGRIMPGIIKSI